MNVDYLLSETGIFLKKNYINGTNPTSLSRLFLLTTVVIIAALKAVRRRNCFWEALSYLMSVCDDAKFRKYTYENLTN